MKWSWKLGEYAGIGVFMHWTFLILIGFIVLSHVSQGSTVAATLEGIIFVLAIFFCVVLHEFGHALTARRYGIKTRDITLLPIGGVASLERMPEEPKQELAVAFAGPAVNVVIAALLLGVLVIMNLWTPADSPDLQERLAWPNRLRLVGGSFLTKLMWVNVIIVAFNLLPAFPMDGGRVLRALLATRMEYARATQVAATVGQAMAILFGFLGLFYNPFLLFIAIFVYLGAGGEAAMVSMRSTFSDVPVRDAMMTRFRVLSEDDSLSTAIEELLAGAQQDFPVASDGQIVGVLPRQTLFKALSQGVQDTRVGEIMDRTCMVVEEDEHLDNTFQRMKELGCSTLPVVREGRVVGLLSMENIGEWAMIQSALKNTPPAAGRRLEQLIEAS
jgi:Zn-dependent protease/predicted transcriptional regulator